MGMSKEIDNTNKIFGKIKVNRYIHFGILLGGIAWGIPAWILVAHFEMKLPVDLIPFLPSYILLLLSLFFKSDRIGFWDRFKRCQSKYKHHSKGIIRCDMRVGHPGNHRYIGWGFWVTRIEWSTDCEIKEADKIKTSKGKEFDADNKGLQEAINGGK